MCYNYATRRGEKTERYKVMKDLTTLNRKESTIEGEIAEYELARLSFCGQEHFIVGVSYLGVTEICPVEAEDEESAYEILSSIIASETTPLILFDTVYDLFG